MGEIVDGAVPEVRGRVAAPTSASTSGAPIRGCSTWSSTCPTTQLKKLTLGGHDPVKVYSAYKAAVEHKGAPTVILARTIKGYGLGEAGEGKNITHQQKKMNEEELRAFRTRFGIPISDAEIADDAVLPAGRGQRRDPATCASAGEALGGFVPRRKVRSAPLAACQPGALRGVPPGHGRPQGLDDDGVRAAAVEAAARHGPRHAGRADRPGRGAHVRHGGALPAGRHLLARGPALRAGRRGHAALLQGSVRRADPRGRDHRGGRRCRRSSRRARRTPRTA